MKALSVAFAAFFLAVSPALAQDEPAAPRAYRPVVEALIADVVVPAHAAFSAAAEREADLLASLCARPGQAGLATAQAGFADLATAFGRVEMFRFGPARQDNRVERLFFWPDRRGRGLQQIQRVIAGEDETAADPATLVDKSVALQGLPALEFVLFGSGSEALAGDASFRCRYGQSVAVAIAGVAQALEAAWRGPFADLVATAGPDNPAYRSHGEALQDLLQAAAEQLEFVSLYKLAAVLGDTADDAHPRRAPLWRSGATLPTIVANLEGVDALLTDDLATLLGADGETVASTRFELRQALERLRPLADDPRDFEAIVADPVGHHLMLIARYPIDGAHQILAQRIPAALGLIAGFNALDGD